MRAGLWGLAGVLSATLGLAQAPAPALPSPRSEVVLAAADVARLPEDARRHQLYLTTLAVQEKELRRFEAAHRYQWGNVSRHPSFKPPVKVGPTLYRVDLRWYTNPNPKLNDTARLPRVRERLAKVDPWFHVQLQERPAYLPKPAGRPKGKTRGAARPAAKPAAKPGPVKIAAPAPWLLTPREVGALARKEMDFAETSIGYLMEQTHSKAPIVRADWWLATACRQIDLNDNETGTGYYDWLGIKNRDDFFALALFKEEDSRTLLLETRAVPARKDTARSGVHQGERQVVRFQALTGGVWGTLDAKSRVGKANARRFLRVGEFQHDAEEWYLRKPDGLPAYLANDKAGAVQASAPDFIGHDVSPLNESTDGRIHTCLACIRCHAGQVLREIDDWTRRTYSLSRDGGKVLLQSPKEEVQDELDRQYLSDLAGQLEADRAAYQSAIAAVTGLDAQAAAVALARSYHAYADDPVGPEQFAREYGVTWPAMRRAILAYQGATGHLDPLLAGLLKEPPEPLRREHAEELYELGNQILGGE